MLWTRQSIHRFHHSRIIFPTFNRSLRLHELGYLTDFLCFCLKRGQDDLRKPTKYFLSILGGYGHQCATLKAKFPKFPGLVIPLPQKLQYVQSSERIIIIAQIFYEPQEIKGMWPLYIESRCLASWVINRGQQIPLLAKLRLNLSCQVLYSILILKSLVPTMEKYSQILVSRCKTSTTERLTVHLVACSCWKTAREESLG